MNTHSITSQPLSPIPPDDLQRSLVIARPERDRDFRHVGLAGGNYTILLSGDDTDGRYCLISMIIPPGGGPPPHRHDFEESFTILEGEIEATFRGKKSVVRAGETVNIPANAPHSFVNSSGKTIKMYCICSPAGQDEYFQLVGVALPTSTATAPKTDPTKQAAARAKAVDLAPKYRTEFLKT
jgi:mannose-6-phosphate isomerase-like protein (cupin superfamily)